MDSFVCSGDYLRGVRDNANIDRTNVVGMTCAPHVPIQRVVAGITLKR